MIWHIVKQEDILLRRKGKLVRVQYNVPQLYLGHLHCAGHSFFWKSHPHIYASIIALYPDGSESKLHISPLLIKRPPSLP
ncbi:MAG TPA: hypothetical protein DCE42_10635 [Myxococcales bacterium]|nr:hypothetical protein [Deltaproteobacteria bacterium]MBU47434.1 hypothetical protein [Deltaproteobacteria bacterium]HAA55202.1 hypothetical protein [Myxococcales bacterium]